MQKAILTLIISCSCIYGQEGTSIQKIDSIIKSRMEQGGTWHQGCPVALEDLRYLQLPYWGFDKYIHHGEMIVHKSVAKEVVVIFQRLYKVHYPIEQMRLVSDFNGSDDASMQANNSSAFNCRLMTGSRSKWSKHSYGKAIDLNPIQNPYVAKGASIVLPKEGRKFIGVFRNHSQNTPQKRAIILKSDPIIQIFNAYGWKWGGSWKSLKDYQHFEKKSTYQKEQKRRVSPKKLFQNLKQEQSKELF